ncbi:transcriptional regulator [Escherichia coli]|uniref:transcriptional regulator n=4 Tax=Escherichia coli TaxID=562 RepID=UPI0020230820|nr:YdaS family helix-turn-helix protein [Escherichia coli]
MEELRIFLNSLSSDEQRMFACECGTSIGYLRKALSKGQVLGASLCVLIERASNGEVTRQQLRPFDWMNIWPELEDTKTSGRIRTAKKCRLRKLPKRISSWE